MMTVKGKTWPVIVKAREVVSMGYDGEESLAPERGLLNSSNPRPHGQGVTIWF